MHLEKLFTFGCDPHSVFLKLVAIVYSFYKEEENVKSEERSAMWDAFDEGRRARMGC